MKPVLSHPWNLDISEAVLLQKQLAPKVCQIKLAKVPRYIAGVDCAPSPDGQFYFAAAVIWDQEEKKIIEQQVKKAPMTFPYVPGLLSFREIPAILKVLESLKQEPDVLMVDGHGIAHPRQFGIASHVGVLFNRPTFGCGKSVLYGIYAEPPLERGSTAPLLSRKGELLGKIVRTRQKVKPVIVSIGHLIDLDSAVDIVLKCNGGCRLPEPTRQADRLVAYKQETC